jgi:hypothetical protein
MDTPKDLDAFLNDLLEHRADEAEATRIDLDAEDRAFVERIVDSVAMGSKAIFIVLQSNDQMQYMLLNTKRAGFRSRSLSGFARWATTGGSAKPNAMDSSSEAETNPLVPAVRRPGVHERRRSLLQAQRNRRHNRRSEGKRSESAPAGAVARASMNRNARGSLRRGAPRFCTRKLERTLPGLRRIHRARRHRPSSMGFWIQRASSGEGLGQRVR